MIESLTIEVIREIKKLLRECVLKMNAVMNASEKLGLIPYFTLNLAETMLSDSHPENLQ